MQNKFYWSQREVDFLRSESQSIFFKNQDYRKELTHFLLAGLKCLGYEKSYEALEEESKQQIQFVFPPKFKELLQ